MNKHKHITEVNLVPRYEVKRIRVEVADRMTNNHQAAVIGANDRQGVRKLLGIVGWQTRDRDLRSKW